MHMWLSEMAEDMAEDVQQLKSVDWESVWEVCFVYLLCVRDNRFVFRTFF